MKFLVVSALMMLSVAPAASAAPVGVSSGRSVAAERVRRVHRVEQRIFEVRRHLAVLDARLEHLTDPAGRELIEYERTRLRTELARLLRGQMILRQKPRHPGRPT